MTDTELRLIEILSALKLRETPIAPESRIISDLGFDSIDIADLAFRIERTFDVALDAPELDALARVRSIPPDHIDEDGYMSSLWRGSIIAVAPNLADLVPDRCRAADFVDVLTVAVLAAAIDRSRGA